VSRAPRSAVAGLLLTGGSSSRMGRNKATITHRSGATWAERAGALLAGVAAPVLEVGPGLSGLLAVADDEEGGGPLSAVVAGWRRLRKLGSELPAMVVACDLPLLSPELLALLAGWPSTSCIVPMLEERPQWCCARYSRECLERASELVASGRRDLRALGEAAGAITGLGPGELGDLAAGLVDADTPDELVALGIDIHSGAESSGATSFGAGPSNVAGLATEERRGRGTLPELATIPGFGTVPA
jgi:molybdopterin-guanine dinucleotide biosynthesis protein A